MSDEQTRETTDILDHQNEAFVKGNIDEIMKDFSEQSLGVYTRRSFGGNG